jgi:hypothetical protein
LGVVAVKQVAQAAGAVSERGEHKRTVGDTLATRGAHPNRVSARDTRNDTAGFGQHAANNLVLDPGSALLVRLADPRQQHNLLLRARVLLVDLHNVQQTVDGQETRRGDGGDPRVLHGSRETVRLERAGETADANLAEYAALTGNFSFEDHPNSNALSVKDRGGKHGLDSMADGVTKVDEVAKTSLALVERNDMGLDPDAFGNDV